MWVTKRIQNQSLIINNYTDERQHWLPALLWLFQKNQSNLDFDCTKIMVEFNYLLIFLNVLWFLDFFKYGLFYAKQKVNLYKLISSFNNTFVFTCYLLSFKD
jgi:hypothetical protein